MAAKARKLPPEEWPEFVADKPMAPVGERCLNRSSDGWTCTREYGHSGIHVGHHSTPVQEKPGAYWIIGGA